METLESSRVCRLCGKQSGISINIFDKNESHVKKINAVLPIVVRHMCFFTTNIHLLPSYVILYACSTCPFLTIVNAPLLNHLFRHQSNVQQSFLLSNQPEHVRTQAFYVLLFHRLFMRSHRIRWFSSSLFSIVGILNDPWIISTYDAKSEVIVTLRANVPRTLLIDCISWKCNRFFFLLYRVPC